MAISLLLKGPLANKPRSKAVLGHNTRLSTSGKTGKIYIYNTLSLSQNIYNMFVTSSDSVHLRTWKSLEALSDSVLRLAFLAKATGSEL